MAERRMFAKSIVLSDAFLDMPMSARCLYFTLGMLADDDGFVGNPKSIMRQCGATGDDMKILLAKRYVLGFESGVIVIKHWRINNFLRSDRHLNTTYVEELESLETDEKGSYTEKINDVGIPSDNQLVGNRYTEVRIDKDNNPLSVPKGTSSPQGEKDEKTEEKKTSRFIKPSVDEIQAYCSERNNGINAQQFYDFYESKGWMIGKNHMKDWRAAVRTWERGRSSPSSGFQSQQGQRKRMTTDIEQRMRYVNEDGTINFKGVLNDR